MNKAYESEVVVLVRNRLLVLVGGKWLTTAAAAAAGPEPKHQAEEGVGEVVAGTEGEEGVVRGCVPFRSEEPLYKMLLS